MRSIILMSNLGQLGVRGHIKINGSAKSINSYD